MWFNALQWPSNVIEHSFVSKHQSVWLHVFFLCDWLTSNVTEHNLMQFPNLLQCDLNYILNYDWKSVTKHMMIDLYQNLLQF